MSRPQEIAVLKKYKFPLVSTTFSVRAICDRNTSGVFVMLPFLHCLGVDAEDYRSYFLKFEQRPPDKAGCVCLFLGSARLAPSPAVKTRSLSVSFNSKSCSSFTPDLRCDVFAMTRCHGLRRRDPVYITVSRLKTPTM